MRPSEGEMKSLEAISHDEVREGFETLYRPNGTIIGVAGNIEWPLLQELVGELLGDWTARDVPAPVNGGAGAKRDHLPHESNQTQIGIAYSCVPFNHPDYIQVSGAVGVLSGGMSAAIH